MNKLINFLEYVSEGKILGIPLDLLFHSVLAFSIFSIVKKLYKDNLLSLFFIFYLGLVKELFDLASQGQSFSSAIFDMLSNFLIIIPYLIFKFRRGAKNRKIIKTM
jgi:hypothetical protein